MSDAATPARRRGLLRRARPWAVAVGVLALVAVGWRHPDTLIGWLVLKPADIVVERRPDPIYEAVIPRYVELCATSQWRKKVAGGGNPFGHATMYLKGACKDAAAPYPQLRRCDRVATDVDDPEHGAGVSVGRWFRNVNWVATPSHALFYGGDIGPGQRLTQAHYDATVRKAIEAGVFDGVELHMGWVQDGDDSLETFVADESIATDFALQYARNLFCARVPVDERQLDEIIAFLNDKNHEYATGAYDYNWNLLADNCVHTLRNALSAAHFWSPLSVLEIRIRHLFNPATPANEFVNLAVLAAEGPKTDPRAIARAAPLDAALFDFGALPNRPGALVKTLPTHPENDVFDPSFRLFAVQSPLRMGATADAVRILSDPRFTDLEANLLHHLQVQEQAIPAREAAAAGLESLRGSPYRRIERAHLEHLRGERTATEELLERVRALKAETPTAAAR